MSGDHKHVASLDPNEVQQRSSRSVSKPEMKFMLIREMMTKNTLIHNFSISNKKSATLNRQILSTALFKLNIF